MSTIAKFRRRSATADGYLTLIRQHPLCAIRSRKDYDTAAKTLDALAIRDDLDRGEQQYVDALEVLIEAYEANAIPVTEDTRTPLERLKAAMRASNTTPVQLRSILGSSQSMVSMILGGQRELSKKSIAKLADYFRLDPGYFL